MQSRPACVADFPAILALNEESVQFLSALPAERLACLHAQADWHHVVEAEGKVIAFLLAFREGADYDSINFRWFAARHSRFLYIDRVVVSRGAQAKGAGSHLYREAFQHASASGLPLVACEFDIDPPNAVSEKFHAKFGFREVGRQPVGYAQKVVSLQVAPVL